jgi:succinate dehydrogenase/fumarate reductase cytochrome b subunit
LFECFGLWLPLLFHGSYGVYLLVRGRPTPGEPNLAADRRWGNWNYVWQRVTGVFLLIFLFLHLGQFRLQVLWGNLSRADYFQELCRGLGGTGVLGVPWLAIFFLLALAAAAFHLSNGLGGFCFVWGVTRSPDGSRRLYDWLRLGGVLLFMLGAATVLRLSTGWRLGSNDLSDELERTETRCADGDRMSSPVAGAASLAPVPSALPRARN